MNHDVTEEHRHAVYRGMTSALSTRVAFEWMDLPCLSCKKAAANMFSVSCDVAFRLRRLLLTEGSGKAGRVFCQRVSPWQLQRRVAEEILNLNARHRHRYLFHSLHVAKGRQPDSGYSLCGMINMCTEGTDLRHSPLILKNIQKLCHCSSERMKRLQSCCASQLESNTFRKGVFSVRSC